MTICDLCKAEKVKLVTLNPEFEGLEVCGECEAKLQRQVDAVDKQVGEWRKSERQKAWQYFKERYRRNGEL